VKKEGVARRIRGEQDWGYLKKRRGKGDKQKREKGNGVKKKRERG
jgi:hypothetical protein